MKATIADKKSAIVRHVTEMLDNHWGRAQMRKAEA